MALNVKIGKIGPLDMLKFSKMPDVREQVIQSTPLSPLPKAYASNAKAELYHPKWQKVVIDEIRQNGADAKTLVLKSENGKALAPFRAGQYISLAITIGQTCTTRSYSLCGSPEWAYQGIYNITVKRDDEGFVSPFIFSLIYISLLLISLPNTNNNGGLSSSLSISVSEYSETVSSLSLSTISDES